MFTPNTDPQNYNIGNAVKVVITNANTTFDYIAPFATRHEKTNNTLTMIWEKDEFGEYGEIIDRILGEISSHSPSSDVDITYGTETDPLTSIEETTINNYRTTVNVISAWLKQYHQLNVNYYDL